jgi:hypothetical protein
MSESISLQPQDEQTDFRAFLPNRYIDMTLAASGSQDAHGYIDNGVLLSKDSQAMPLGVYEHKIERKLHSPFVSQGRKQIIRTVIEAAQNGEAVNSGRIKG